MNRNTKFGYVVVGLMTIIALTSMFVCAADFPYGMREITYVQSSRPDPSNQTRYPPAFLDAQAGNVTELSLVGISTTESWQGYYGNISGEITLEDVNGYVFYNWTTAEPKGQIYSSTNGVIDWLNIRCFDWTGQPITLASEEARYGISPESPDGINETFIDDNLNSDIYVGSSNISGNATVFGITCHTSNPYQYDSQNNNKDNFENFLLEDEAGALVFGTVIENNEWNNVTDLVGYDNQPHDFQLLVAENGHQGEEDTNTPYFFWAELK
jgi:hypothetical protein